jgi:hypothetical protein
MPVTPAQLALALGIRPGQKPQPKPAPKPAPTPESKQRPQPSTGTGFDARDASAEDIERRYAQLGLSAPGTDHRRMQPPPADPTAQRVATRALARIERDRARADQARAAAINAGAIDGRNATDEEVRARMQSLGVDTTSVITRQERPVVSTANDREVAASVRKAIANGKHVDLQKLSPGERKALAELGNTGYQRGLNGLGY